MKKSTRALLIIFILYGFYVTLFNSDALAINEGKLLRIARQLEHSERFEDALAIYQQLWQEKRKNISYYRGVYKNLIRLNRFDEARDVTVQMTTFTRSHSIKANLGEIYYKAGDKAKALATWSEIIEKHKNDKYVYSAVANSMISNRLVQEAIEIYKSGRERFKNTSYFLMELANLYAIGFDYEKATQAYLELMKLDSTRYTYIENQVLRLGKEKEELNTIIHIIEKAISKDKDNITLHKLLASLYIKSSDYLSAFEIFKKIDELSGVSQKKGDKTKNSLLNFAKLALRDGELDHSIKAFNLYTSRYPESDGVIEAYMGLAEAYFKQSKFNQSIENYNLIVENHNDHFFAQTALINIGKIYMNNLGEYRLAQNAFNKVINRIPRSPQFYTAMYHMGECLIKIGEVKDGKGWFSKIIESNGASAELKEKSQFYSALVDYWEGEFDNSIEKLTELTNIQSPARMGDDRGLMVNDALDLLIKIEENRKNEDALKIYAQSDILIYQNKYRDALKKLNSLSSTNIDNNLHEYVIFRSGEIYVKLANYQKAIEQFQFLISEQPESSLCDDAQKRIADINNFYLNNKKDAIEAYETLLVNYPESLLIEEVRNKIRGLQSN